jgi:hypothetical protein
MIVPAYGPHPDSWQVAGRLDRAASESVVLVTFDSIRGRERHSLTMCAETLRTKRVWQSNSCRYASLRYRRAQ